MITLDKVRFAFDKKAILSPAERMQVSLLKKAGAYTRTVQRNSLKRGKPGQTSRRGQPPLRHSQRPDIKDTVFYFVDPANKTMVCGMVLLRGKPAGDQAMPGVLEHSGHVTMSVRRKTRAGQANKRRVRARVDERPSAGPAFKKMTNKLLPDLIKGGIMKEA